MNIKTAFSGGRLTIFLSGELDHHEARRLMYAMDELVDEYLPRDCILELSELSFMDSSGIAIIIKLSRRMKTLGGRMWIENPGSQPQRVIDASGIERLVPIALSK